MQEIYFQYSQDENVSSLHIDILFMMNDEVAIDRNDAAHDNRIANERDRERERERGDGGDKRKWLYTSTHTHTHNNKNHIMHRRLSSYSRFQLCVPW